jgi:hypothetical protein
MRGINAARGNHRFVTTLAGIIADKFGRFGFTASFGSAVECETPALFGIDADFFQALGLQKG